MLAFRNRLRHRNSSPFQRSRRYSLGGVEGLLEHFVESAGGYNSERVVYRQAPPHVFRLFLLPPVKVQVGFSRVRSRKTTHSSLSFLLRAVSDTRLLSPFTIPFSQTKLSFFRGSATASSWTRHLPTSPTIQTLGCSTRGTATTCWPRTKPGRSRSTRARRSILSSTTRRASKTTPR